MPAKRSRLQDDADDEYIETRPPRRHKTTHSPSRAKPSHGGKGNSGQTQPRINLLDLPLEFREMIWSYCTRPADAENWILPVNAHRARVRRYRLHNWSNGVSAPMDCAITKINEQVRAEALAVLFREQKIRVPEDMDTQDGCVKNGLRNILQHARRLELYITSIDPKAWYIDALAANGNLKQLRIIINDEDYDCFQFRWEGNMEKAKEDVWGFRRVKVLDFVEFMYPGAEYEGPGLVADLPAYTDEVLDYIESVVMPIMLKH